jgi:FkbM family methyltransferase
MWQRFKKLIKETRAYPRYRDKLLSFYNVLLISRKLSWVPFPGRHRQVGIVLQGHNHPFAVRLGSTDWLVLVEIFLDGEYAELLPLFRGSPPATIIDLGANVGFSVRYWLKMFPEARVVAVEPDAENCAMIQRNIALCCPPRAPQIIQACIVGQPRESVLFETASGREWGYAITNSISPTTRSIRAITMEILIAECSVTGPIELLKCDIEGGEVELFERCEAWIQLVRRGIVEVHGQFLVANLLSKLRENGVNIAPRFAAKPDICLFEVTAS